MKCKYCQAELESNSSVCPACGKDNLKDSLMPLKIVTLSLVCLVMLVLLGGMVNYGVTGSFLPGWLAKPTPTPSTGPTANAIVVNTDKGQVSMDEAAMQAAMDEVVATMGSHKLTNRELQLYYWMSVSTYGKDADVTKDLSTQIYDKETGKSYQEYCLEKALEAWQEVTLMAEAAKKEDFKLPQEYQDDLNNLEKDMKNYAAYYGLASVDDLIHLQCGKGCDFATYSAYMNASYLGGLYWSDLVTNMEITEQQIEDYFKKNEETLKKEYDVDKNSGNMVDFRRILINAGTSAAITEDDWAAALAEAQKLYDDWKAAGGTEDSFIELAGKHSDDKNSASKGGLYENQIQGYLTEVDVRHILILPEGATSANVNTQEWPDKAWAYAEHKAQEILDQYLAGELTEEAFGELAKANSADGNAKEGGLYTDVYMGKMVKPFQNWCFDASRKPGDTGIVKTEFGYHVMFFVRADNEGDQWLFGQEHEAGDCAIVKTDSGYQILYYITGEAAWHRYSRYGAKSELGDELLDKLVGENPFTFDRSKFVLTPII